MLTVDQFIETYPNLCQFGKKEKYKFRNPKDFSKEQWKNIGASTLAGATLGIFAVPSIAKKTKKSATYTRTRRGKQEIVRKGKRKKKGKWSLGQLALGTLGAVASVGLVLMLVKSGNKNNINYNPKVTPPPSRPRAKSYEPNKEWVDDYHKKKEFISQVKYNLDTLKHNAKAAKQSNKQSKSYSNTPKGYTTINVNSKRI